MADINDPQLSKPINDKEMSSQQELVEKPYNDNVSAPTIQNPTDNIQPQIQNPTNNQPLYNPPSYIQSQYPNQNNIQAPIYNPNNNPPPYYNPNSNQPQYYPPQGTPQQVNQAYPGAGPYYSPPVNNNNNMNYNNGNYYNSQHQVAPQRKSCLLNPITVAILSIINILVVIIDLIIQIISEFLTLVLIDDVCLFIIAITYLILIYKRKSLDHQALGAATIIVWFVGAVLRVCAGYQLEKEEKSSFLPLLTIVRSFALFFCIPSSCLQKRSK